MKMLLILLPLFLLIGALALLFKLLETRKALRPDTGDDARPSEGPLPYRRSEKPLLSESERQFFGALEQAVGQVSAGKGRVLAQIPLSRVIEAKAGDGSERQRWHNKSDRKSVDFVVVDSAFRVRAAIELDDASHRRQSRAERDDFVERACRDAGVTLVRFAARSQYDVGALADELEKAMEGLSAVVTSGSR